MLFLIAEDDLSSRLILQQMLSPYGESHIAVNGKEAVELFKNSLEGNQPYDAIFLDIMMPIMDGNKALKEIRRIEKEKFGVGYKQVYIMMVTALNTPKEVIESFYEGGCSSYVVKPIDRRKIIGKLREDKIVK
ncbi:MAG TPA: response regulator [Ignavibacteriales bacterium]|nr:response regulator [Ignavibacteriales bacterium]HOL80812.1 response regulator [Ignavibacteriales bacterium]HOM66169.1 response regulator [Ignavibacteriales bacterium]HPP33248.1 response regulator [Ignavibacteriales bacterium]HRR17924.1 response regulator [Ignavibacteriales bacterium]